jgi:hypothetical protein
MDHTDGQTRMGRLGQVIQYFSNLQNALLMLRIGVVVRRLIHVSRVSRRSDLVKRAPAIGRPEGLMKHDGHPNIRASKRQLWVSYRSARR